ncbi:transcription cofactor vestigial-like protein 4 [Thalassophryne amazonica]|uniref:transcription cofactor vestigial-like protein 4 n=1 Tax=Thalassophryne amazonica TaxID=390379 RepID=UPI001471D41A|nr:transcription cofactor vestigial-like protein 4 [Thalassophryne amazonica]XP_034028676.1 transcription cofactor vestigial-like protein 4 [Thalassophryne amazonica]XP_034028677.1 transcription cofactor vestigial-like protein 4 [Thalassophryne amazonica]
MLFIRMDLLNSQFLDKMNNNIGRLHFEDEFRMPSLPTAVTNITGPPPNCPSKRKYGEDQVAQDQFNCDDDHMNKMSRLFGTQLTQPSAGDSEHWSIIHSPMEHISSSSNGIHGNHLYSSISGFAVDQPLALTKTSLDLGAGVRSSVDRQQNRPSVITCAPANNRNCNLLHCHMNGCSPGTPADQTKANANMVCDPVIEEHFRRSLGENYKESEPVSNLVSITGSVDDHFAKALGDAWLQIKAKGGGPPTTEADQLSRGV